MSCIFRYEISMYKGCTKSLWHLMSMSLIRLQSLIVNHQFVVSVMCIVSEHSSVNLQVIKTLSEAISLSVNFTFSRMTELTNRDWRPILLFLFKEGETPTQSAERLKAAFGDSAPARSTISKWFGRFAGQRSLEDNKCCGRPSSHGNEENEELVWQLIQSDHRITFDELEEKSSLSHGTLQWIIRDRLELSKVSAHWVPRLLTEEQKEVRVTNSSACLGLLEDYGDAFWRRFITADKTPLHFQIFGVLPSLKRKSRIGLQSRFVNSVILENVKLTDKLMASDSVLITCRLTDECSLTMHMTDTTNWWLTNKDWSRIKDMLIKCHKLLVHPS